MKTFKQFMCEAQRNFKDGWQWDDGEGGYYHPQYGYIIGHGTQWVLYAKGNRSYFDTLRDAKEYAKSEWESQSST